MLRTKRESAAPPRRAGARRGLTLIELLIVIAVVVVLAAVAIPLIRLGMEGRKVREGARQLNALFSAAQAKAAERGRPVGLWLERFDNANRPEIHRAACVRVYFADTPAPYVGDALNSVVSNVTINSGGGFAWSAEADLMNTLMAPSLAQVGDLIRFEHRGHYYRITGITPGTPPNQHITKIDFTHDIEHAPSRGVIFGKSFEILRQPRRSLTPPDDVPTDAAIDLSVSGVGAAGWEFAPTGPGDNTPVVIMFSPEGGIDSVYVSATKQRPTGPLHFLVGRLDQVNGPAPLVPPASDAICNLRDMAAIWVSVNHRSGLVTTSNNVENSAAATQAAAVAQGRQLARQAQTIGD